MSYALTTIWHERQRFLPAVLAVAFSALLIAMQVGLLLGLFTVVSLPIDHSSADIWVGSPGVQSIDLGVPIPEAWETRLAAQPEVARTETYISGIASWSKANGGIELCLVIGTHLEAEALGAIEALTPEMRIRLTEPGAIVLDETGIEALGVNVEDVAEMAGCRVRVVGVVRGYKDIAGSYIFCSLRTARMLLHVPQDQATYLLARCHNPKDAPAVVQRLQAYANQATFTREEFSLRSRMHWLLMTKAGLALAATASLGLLVGAAVTSQTLYAATAAAIREYATLEALGIPGWRMSAMVLTQSLWVGIAGVIVALPTIVGLAWLATSMGVRVQLPSWLLASTVVLTLVMAMMAGLIALRSLRLVEPATLLR